jgi:hydrogenase maturation protein HypF
MLACGAELKNSFCLSRDTQAFTSQHIGDLKSPATFSFFEKSVQYFQDLLVITPELAVCDLHPDYLSSRYAERSGLPLVRVQHHHAHAAAVMAEHHIEEAIAVILDGTGLGTDGTVWGGEFFHIDRRRCKRLGYLLPIPMPGGDAAATGIWRMGLSLLDASGIDIMDHKLLTPAMAAISAQDRSVIQAMIKKDINAPMASSTGRLFDAVASLLGVRQEVTYEAQGAIELESLAWRAVDSGLQTHNSERWYPSVLEKAGGMVIDTACLAPWILGDMGKGVPGSETALHFHMWLAHSGVEVIKILAERRAVRRVILGGGCFQNRLLLDIFTKELEKYGFSVYTGETIPVNDAGISVGQVFVAGCQAGGVQLSDTMPGFIQSNHQ